MDPETFDEYWRFWIPEHTTLSAAQPLPSHALALQDDLHAEFRTTLRGHSVEARPLDASRMPAAGPTSTEIEVSVYVLGSPLAMACSPFAQDAQLRDTYENYPSLEEID